MSIVKGYNIQNLGNNKYVDLYGSNAAPGTTIFTWSLNNQTTGTLNQQWRLSESGAGTNRFLIRASNPPSFAYIDGVAAENTQITGDSRRTDWEVVPLQDGNTPSGASIIMHPHSNLAWTVSGDKIVLQKYDASNKNQQFVLKTIN